MIALVEIQRRGDAIEAQIASEHSVNTRILQLDSSPVLQVFENNDSYVFVCMFVLDEQSAIKYLAEQSPMDITLKSPNITEVIRI